MDALIPHLLKYADGIWHAGFEGVIGVHQERAGIGIEPGIFLEGGVLVLETHDPAVGVRSHDGDVKHLSGEDVGGSHASTDDGRARTIQSGVRSLCPPQAKLHDAVALRRVHDAGSLCGNQALVVDDVENRRFHELSLHDGSHDL